MYISDDATPDEVREMAAERRALAAQDRALRTAWIADPRILMAQAVSRYVPSQTVPVLADPWLRRGQLPPYAVVAGLNGRSRLRRLLTAAAVRLLAWLGR